MRLRLGLSRLSLSCRLCRSSDLLLTLRQSLVHLDHLVIKTVSGRVKLGSTVARVVVIQLLLSLLFALLEKCLSLGLQSCLTALQTVVEDWLRIWLCLSLSLRRLVASAFSRSCGDVGSFELSFKFLTLQTQHFSEALAFVGVFGLAEVKTGVSIVKSRNFLDVGHANLVNDLFLLFEELLRVDFWRWVFDWCRFWLRGWRLHRSRFRRILLLFLAFTFKFSELTQLFIFLSLLFRVYVSDNSLRRWPGCLRLCLGLLNYRLFLLLGGCRSRR